MLERLFKIHARGSTPGREAAAGVTTFLTMAYIIVVNPDILAATGMDHGALITATILAAAFGTLLSGLWANVPFAMAPGMGLNAFFAYSLVVGQQVSWQTALGVVFISGVVFLVLTLLGVRRHVVAAIPDELRLAIAAGIGLFITFIGAQKLGLIVDHPATLVALGPLDTPVVLGLAGLLATAVLAIRKIRGAILIGIVLTTVLGVLFGQVQLPDRLVDTPPSLAPIFMQMDLGSALRWGMWGAIFSFMFVDLFDSVGTIVACSYEAGLVEEDGTIDGLDRVLEADAVATVVGAVLGTSTTTTYIESGAGVAAGGRTGLANLTTAAAVPGRPGRHPAHRHGARVCHGAGPDHGGRGHVPQRVAHRFQEPGGGRARVHDHHPHAPDLQHQHGPGLRFPGLHRGLGGRRQGCGGASGDVGHRPDLGAGDRACGRRSRLSGNYPLPVA